MLTKKFDMEEYKNFKLIWQDYFDSGALPKWIDNMPKAVMVLQAWYDLGLSPTQAINWLYMINWKISVYWETAILLMKQAGYKIKTLESTSKIARVHISKDGEEQEFEFTIEEAAHAGLTTGGMWIWRKYPRQMLLYKAFAFARKFFAPDCLWWYLIKEELDWEIKEDITIEDEAEVFDGFEKEEEIIDLDDDQEKND